MKIAYIVLCHKNAEQLNLLFKHLSEQDCEIFVHIDKKNKVLDSEIDYFPNVHILDFQSRVDVKWGRISQVDAILNLIKFVLQKKYEFDYLWLISGQDLPIKSNSYILNYLQEMSGCSFIDIVPTGTNRYQRLLKRNEVWTAQWLVGKGKLKRIIRNVWYLITGGRFHTFKICRRKLQNDCFYFGSTWWCLPYSVILEMVEYLNANPKFYQFYSHCHCPDESFFQTLLMNHVTTKGEIKSMLTYVDWKGCKDSPRIITEEDGDKVLDDAYHLFARKFDIQIDRKIVDKVIYQISRCE